MGKPPLVWSPIALKMANEQKIMPFGRPESIWIDIDGIRSTNTFEVIEIMDDSIPFPTLLGLEWAFENLSLVNLKKRQLVLEQGNLRVIAPLEPKAGKIYVETIHGGMAVEGVDDLYKITMRDDDYINPIAEGMLRWRGINTYSSDSEEGLENWQHRLHEVSTRRCARITKALCWIGMEIYELPMFDEEGNVETFIMKYEEIVVETQRLLALDVALRAALARWWTMHKLTINSWE